MDLSSLALYDKLGRDFEDIFDKKSISGVDIIVDMLVVNFISREIWKTKTWEQYFEKSNAFREHLFETLETASKEIAARLREARIVNAANPERREV